VNLDRIEIDAEKLVKKDPSQAERFYGNINTTGSGSWFEDGQWAAKLLIRDRPKSEPVGMGFDGSDSSDWTGIRLETMSQHQFTPVYGVDKRPTVWKPRQWNGKVPRDEVMVAFHELFREYDIVRAYLDPPMWSSEIAALQGQYSDKVVVDWATYRPRQMHFELERLHADVVNEQSAFTHDACPDTALCMRNAVKRSRAGETYILGKPADEQKIDLAMSSTLAHAAVLDATAAGLIGKRKQNQVSDTFYGF
jgi:phage terminase large subunit-like protein